MGSEDYKNSEVLLPTAIVKDKIFLERNKKGYKQAWIANQLGITEKAYRNIEQGITQKIQVKRLQDIARILGMEDWHTFLEENQQKINQINGDNSDLNNSQIVHLYPSDTNLIHEKEKLTFQLAAQEKEIAALQREKQLLQDKIQTLEELLLVYRQQAKA